MNAGGRGCRTLKLDGARVRLSRDEAKSLCKHVRRYELELCHCPYHIEPRWSSVVVLMEYLSIAAAVVRKCD